MKRDIKCIFIIMMLLLSNNSFSYFYYFCVAKKNDRKNNSQQHIVFLADYHDKTHAINKEQRAYLESLLKKCCGKKVKLIVEDLSSVNNDGRMICCNYGINCAQGVLGHLANKARSFGIVVDNVEYRYCRVASIGPLINDLKAAPHSFKSTSSIALSSLYKEIIHEIEKIKKYNDGKKLNNFYKRILLAVSAKLSQLKWADAADKKTVACYCAALQKGQYRQELEKLCIFDSALIDINIIHSIVNCDASLIFVVAGGSHIEQVRDFLKKNNYEIICSSPDNGTNPTDISLVNRFIQ